MKHFAMVAIIAVAVAATGSADVQAPKTTAKSKIGKDVVILRYFDFRLCCGSDGAAITYVDGETIPETAKTGGYFELGVSSLTGANLENVEYRIYSTTTNFDTGVQSLSSVAFSGVTMPHAPWTMVMGKHTFIAVVDPNRKLGESDVQRMNNTATMTINIPSLIDTRIVDPAAVGAPLPYILKAHLDDPSHVCQSSGPTGSYLGIDLKLYYTGPKPPPSGTELCQLVGEFFSGVRVGNGWVLTDASVDDQGGYHDASDQPQWEVQPRGTSLYGRLNIRIQYWTFPPHIVTVRYHIQGPRGTQPSYSFIPLITR